MYTYSSIFCLWILSCERCTNSPLIGMTNVGDVWQEPSEAGLIEFPTSCLCCCRCPVAWGLVMRKAWQNSLEKQTVELQMEVSSFINVNVYSLIGNMCAKWSDEIMLIPGMLTSVLTPKYTSMLHAALSMIHELYYSRDHHHALIGPTYLLT